jgi:hypothetical protein
LHDLRSRTAPSGNARRLRSAAEDREIRPSRIIEKLNPALENVRSSGFLRLSFRRRRGKSAGDIDGAAGADNIAPERGGASEVGASPVLVAARAEWLDGALNVLAVGLPLVVLLMLIYWLVTWREGG